MNVSGYVLSYSQKMLSDIVLLYSNVYLQVYEDISVINNNRP